jgi:NAD(P)H-dependent FMN reductase
VGFVSYGGISGGLRAVQATKITLSAVKAVVVSEAVTIPFVSRQVKDGVFTPNEVQEKAAPAMLDSLAKWVEALRQLR